MCQIIKEKNFVLQVKWPIFLFKKWIIEIVTINYWIKWLIILKKFESKRLKRLRASIIIKIEIIK